MGQLVLLGVGKVEIFEFESRREEFEFHRYEDGFLQFLGQFVTRADVHLHYFEFLYVLFAEF